MQVLMVRFTLCIAILLILKFNGSAQSYGLTFNSHEVVPEKRTSLDLSPEDSFCLANNSEFSFNFNFRPNHQIYFGYVFRLIYGNKNIDLIYNQATMSFNIITGENFSGISFSIDSMRLYKEWNKFSLKFNLENHTLQCSVNSKIIGSSPLPIVSNNCFKLLWGANDFQKFKTRDIPPMQIKDIRILENNSLKHFWPLDEKSGDTAYDKVSHKTARAKNPSWSKPKYQNWEMIGSFTTNGYAGVAFDAKHDKLYVTGADSLASYSPGIDQSLSWLPLKHQNLPLGHQSIYDTLNNKLLDVYIDQKKVVPFDFTNRGWEYMFPGGPMRITDYWHSNKFISTQDSSLYYIGGYGYLRYKNSVYRYHFRTRNWDTLKPSGDYFPPKYLSALGTDPEGKYAYILGGYGSETGDQMLDPRYYYDLFRFNIKENSFKKIYTIKAPGTSFTFANNLVIDQPSNAYYGLIFSKDSYHSSLQLVKGSLTDSTLHFLGDSINYNFHDVQSYADLFYSTVSNKLIAVTLLYSPVEAKESVDAKEKNTEVKIYTLNFPPEPLDNNTKQDLISNPKKMNWTMITSGILASLFILFFIFRKKILIRRTQPVKELTPYINIEEPEQTPLTYQQHHTEKNHSSSVFLFGQFQAFDKEGNDIVRLFTPLLKELFLIIAIYTIRTGRGISSEGLKEILWHDKSDKDANNNRSVNLAKLKVILEKIGSIVINKDSGNWQLVIMEDDVQIDYKNYTLLLHASSRLDKEFIHSLADIVKRGGFLSQTEYKWLDDIKSEISNAVIDNCLAYIKTHGITKDPEAIIEITNYIFYFDPLNEDALAYKCKCLILLKRHTLANNCYVKFIKDYKDIYGEDFAKSFHDIII